MARVKMPGYWLLHQRGVWRSDVTRKRRVLGQCEPVGRVAVMMKASVLWKHHDGLPWYARPGNKDCKDLYTYGPACAWTMSRIAVYRQAYVAKTLPCLVTVSNAQLLFCGRPCGRHLPVVIKRLSFAVNIGNPSEITSSVWQEIWTDRARQN